MKPVDETENLYVLSGGGALFAWQFGVLCELAAAGLRPSMLGSTSTGTIGAFMFSKGLIAQAHELCDEVYSTNAKALTKPGIGEIKDGKIKVNWFKALTQLAFKKNKIVSLMDNRPLIDTLTKIDTEHPGFQVPVFYNRVDMKTGKLDECSTLQPMGQQERIESFVASTAIPVVWPLTEGRWGDGGLREGTPLSAMFARTKPGKKYRIIVISCNNDEMASADDLSRIDKIAFRTGGVVLNETLVNDLGRTQDRNEVAKAVSAHRSGLVNWIDNYLQYLPSQGIKELQALSDSLFTALPHNHAPIYFIKYKGPYSTFSFTKESLAEQRINARISTSEFLKSTSL